MKSAIFPDEVDELQDLEIKGWIQLPDNRKSFSVAMIVFLLGKQCPLQAVSRRTVQRAIADLRNIGVELNSVMSGNTPYYDVFATKVILTNLKFKTK
jgi:predicted DNA-binding transcriptional regulator YafY